MNGFPLKSSQQSRTKNAAKGRRAYLIAPTRGREAAALGYIAADAKRRLDVAAQHGSVRVLMRDGKPVSEVISNPANPLKVKH